jgi:hypothetical protein
MTDERARPLPDCYRVEPGPLLAGGYPGGASSGRPDAVCRRCSTRAWGPSST